MMMIIQTLLQIILESLPISSSGHLVLAEKIMHWQEIPKTVEYLLHGPTIVVLIVYFRATWIHLLLHCWRYRALLMRMIFLGAAATLVTVPLYCGMQWLAPLFPLSLGFACTASFLFSLRFVSYQHEQMSYKKALLLGCVQGISGLPGISRLASTYVAGVWLGLTPKKSFYFSCMMQFPLICAGFLYGLFKTPELAKAARGEWFCVSKIISNHAVSNSIAISAATAIAYFLLWWVQRCMQQHTLWKFGYYMLLPLTLALAI